MRIPHDPQARHDDRYASTPRPSDLERMAEHARQIETLEFELAAPDWHYSPDPVQRDIQRAHGRRSLVAHRRSLAELEADIATAERGFAAAAQQRRRI